MANRKTKKQMITEAVLEHLPNQSVDIEDTIFQWWMTGRQEGLRLTDIGDTAFRLAEIEFYTFPADKIPAGSWYHFIIELNRKIKCPYYLSVTTEAGKKGEPFIRIYDGKIATLLSIYGNLKDYLESVKVRKR